MSSERASLIRRLADEAARLPPPERSAMLDRVCGQDTALRAAVESRLLPPSEAETLAEAPSTAGSGSGSAGGRLVAPAASHAEPGSHGAQPPADGRSQPTAYTAIAPPAPGQRFGRYRLIRVLGEGGMGAVHLAEQESPKRTVALKVIRPGAASPATLRRFELEAQVLGRLQHPGIAQVYEAGTVDTGLGPQPFFAMEYVRGRSLSEAAANLPLRDRLELFCLVCEAVQYAHTRGVIHRDLKPANILVDDQRRPKILDFGVARVTDVDVRQATFHTEVGQLVGTVPYMSPEQVLGDPDELDTRSDVYTLGVILYELLTGRLPYELDRSSLHEATRIIREAEPARPAAIAPSLRGDLDTILRKVLEKDRQRRYQSAGELQADIRRYLDDEPILARPPSITYQLRKFARRNRAVVVGAAAVLAAMVLGLVGTSFGLSRAVAARAAESEQRGIAEARALEAELALDESRAVLEFITSMLESADPLESRGEALTVRELLDSAAETLDQRLGGRPAALAAIHHTIGQTYQGLGLFDQAERHLGLAVWHMNTFAGPTDERTLRARASHAAVFRWLGKLDQAAQMQEEVIRLAEEQYGPESTISLGARNDLALTYQDLGRLEDSAELLTAALQQSRRVYGIDSRDTLRSQVNLGSTLRMLGRFDQAEPLLEDAVERVSRTSGENDVDTIRARNALAALRFGQDRAAEAADQLQAMLGPARAVFGPEHAETSIIENNLAVALQEVGRFDEARAVYASLVDGRSQRLGRNHPDTLAARANFGRFLLDTGDLDEAERVIRAVSADSLATLGAAHRDTLASEYDLARLLQARGRLEEAADAYAHVVRRAEQVLEPDDWYRGIFLSRLGDCLTQLQRYDDAEARLLEAHSILAGTMGDDSRFARQAAERLATVYAALGRDDEARRWTDRAARPDPDLP